MLHGSAELPLVLLVSERRPSKDLVYFSEVTLHVVITVTSEPPLAIWNRASQAFSLLAEEMTF